MNSGTLLFSTNTDSDDLSVVDAKERKQVARISVGGSPRGSVKFDKPKTFGYVSNCAGDTISVIDLLGLREIARIKVGLAPRGISISGDGKYAFVSNSGSNTLSVVDLTQRAQVAELAVGENPRHMAILPGKSVILVSQWGSDAVAVVDYSHGIAAMSTPKYIPVGADARPYSLTVNQTGDRAYVANTQADYMSVIDPIAGREIVRVTVGYGGRAIALSADQKYAFISVEPPNEMAVVDLAKNAVVHRVQVGPSPRGLAIDEESKLAYLSNFGRGLSTMASRNTLSIVDVSNPLNARHVGEIRVGLGPCSVSVLATQH